MSGFRSRRREKRTQMKAVAQVRILPAPQWHGTGEWDGGGNTVPGCPEFAPLPIAVRVDAALLAGERQLIPTSRLTWWRRAQESSTPS
jgi:hypothetical protein